MGRRVVVTGIGLICAVGNTTGEVWQAVLAGKSGVARITQFDSSNFACQIAAEVKNFDPLNFIEKKEVKKMGRFIHLAIAAADEAFKMSALQITPENAERVGVHIGSGIGGFDIIEREHTALREGGPRDVYKRQPHTAGKSFFARSRMIGQTIEFPELFCSEHPRDGFHVVVRCVDISAEVAVQANAFVFTYAALVGV